MKFNWVDYCEKHEDKIEIWIEDVDTRSFATFDDTIKEMYVSFGQEYKLNDRYFCKIVLDGDIIVAVLFLIVGGYSCNTIHINPIIVNPKYRNKGYCTKIIRELVNHGSEIMGYDISVVTADFDLENKASIRAFEKVGFVMAGMCATGDFLYWIYPASELENYRKYCANEMGDKFVISTL